MQNIPLAERIRPRKISDIIGQKHLLGERGTLKLSIKNKLIPSIILWGPPGVGKTTLANLIAKELERDFYTLSAINSGVKDVRKIIEKASSQGLLEKTYQFYLLMRFIDLVKLNKTLYLELLKKG